MPRSSGPRPPISPKRKATKTPSAATKAKVKSAVRAKRLVDALLREMQQGVKNPKYRESDEWEKLFGSKDSLVVNLQKLVATLAALPEETVKKGKAVEAPLQPISAEELALLKAWIEETNDEL